MKNFFSNLFGQKKQPDIKEDVGYRFICNHCFNQIEEGETRYRSLDRKGVDICAPCYKILKQDIARLNNEDFAKEYKEKSAITKDEWLILEPLHTFRMKFKMVNSEHSCLTVAKAFLTYSHRPCFGTRIGNSDQYQWHSYKEVFEQVTRAALALKNLIPQQQAADQLNYVGICAKNREDYFIVDYALLLRNMVSVPIHNTLIPGDMEHIIDNAKICCVFTGSADLTRIYVDLVKQGKCPSLKHIIQFDVLAPEDQSLVQNLPLKLHDYNTLLTKESKEATKLLKLPEDKLLKQLCIVPRDDSQMVTLIYTSGSTGKPKGVVITDSAWNKSVLNSVPCDPYIVISFAPLSHMSDRKHVLLSICNGGRIGIFTGEMENIFEDIKIIRPTIIVSTPRLWNMLFSEYQKFLEDYKKKFQQQEGSVEQVSEGDFVKKVEEKALSDFSPILGGRLQMIVTGGASTSEAVKSFLKKCFHCHINDGYGATEVGGIMDNGYIKENVLFKLVDVPEMGYLQSDKPYPRGEFCVKTETMFSGYFNNDSLTKNMLDEEGFYHTGDIVELQGAKKIKIIDRIKNIFKLAQGEFVAPERLETVYIESQYITNIFVYGNTVRSYVIAVVIPNTEKVLEWAKVNCNVQVDSLNIDWINEHGADPALQKLFADECISLAKKNGLQPYEIPRRFVIDTRPFTVENEMLTASFKLKRVSCENYYKARLEQVYEELEAEEKVKLQADLNQILQSALGKEGSVELDSFSSLGVDSLHAVKIASLIRNKYSIDVPLKLLFAPNANISQLSTFIHDKQSGNANPNQDAVLVDQLKVKVNWMEEVSRLLDPCIDAKNCSSTTPVPLPLPLMNHVLLTGCTGFLGSFLLSNLLLETSNNCKVYCIVRAKSNEEAKSRILESLNLHCLLSNNNNIEKLIQEKLVALAGDLSIEEFGLKNDKKKQQQEEEQQNDNNNNIYNLLASQIEVIYHNAAHVNAVYTFEQLKAANVTATVNVLKFATLQKLKHIHYVSTIGVVQGSNLKFEDAPLTLHSAIDMSSGYSQSKWVSEMLVHTASRERNVPCTVFRPGMIGPDTEHGVGNDNDWVMRLIKGSVMLGSYPDTNERDLDLIPVNHASKAILKISEQDAQAYEHCKKGCAYHVINCQNLVTLEFIFKTIAATSHPKLEKRGFKTWKKMLEEKVKKFQEEKMEDCAEFQAYWPLLTLFKGDSFPQSGGHFDNAMLVAKLGDFKLAKIDQNYIVNFVKQFTSAAVF